MARYLRTEFSACLPRTASPYGLALTLASTQPAPFCAAAAGIVQCICIRLLMPQPHKARAITSPNAQPAPSPQRRRDQALGVLAVPFGGAEQAADFPPLAV